jgi:hypothetical protein
MTATIPRRLLKLCMEFPLLVGIGRETRATSAPW